MTWHDRGWNAGDWLPMGFLMLFLWAMLIFGGLWLLTRGRDGQPPARSNARQILDDRLARGEIGPEEYRARRDQLDEK